MRQVIHYPPQCVSQNRAHKNLAAPRADKITARKSKSTARKSKFAACKSKPQHSKASLSFWNSDLLPRIDEVRVLDNLAVGVENNLVFVRVAVEFLRDFR